MSLSSSWFWMSGVPAAPSAQLLRLVQAAPLVGSGGDLGAADEDPDGRPGRPPLPGVGRRRRRRCRGRGRGRRRRPASPSDPGLPWDPGCGSDPASSSDPASLSDRWFGGGGRRRAAMVRTRRGPCRSPGWRTSAPSRLAPTIASSIFLPDLTVDRLSGTVSQRPGWPVAPIRPTTAEASAGPCSRSPCPRSTSRRSVDRAAAHCCDRGRTAGAGPTVTGPDSSGRVNRSSVRCWSPASARSAAGCRRRSCGRGSATGPGRPHRRPR